MKWQPTPVFLPGESQGQGSLVGCHLWVAQSWTRLKQQQQQQFPLPGGFPGGSDGEESACNAGDLNSLAGLPTPVSLLGEFHGQWSLEDYNPRGHKESDTLMTNTFPFFTFSLPGTLPVSEVLVEFTRALRCERWTPNWLTQIGKKKKKN